MNWDVNASSKTEAVGLGACPDKLAEIVTRTLTVVAMNCATQGKTTPIAMEVELFNQCEMGDKEAFDSIGKDESKAIDLLMQYYTKGIEQKEEVGKFISSIGILPQKIEKST